MAILLRMPEISANLESATIVAWSKAEGDRVQAGDCLADIETDKAVVEWEAEQDGVLGPVLVPAGQEVAVSTPVAVLLEEGEASVDVDALLGAARPQVDEAASRCPDGHSTDMKTTASDLDSVAVAPDLDAAAPARILASPLARNLAARSGMALAGLAGSGPGGRVVRRDVEAAARAAGLLPASVGLEPAQHSRTAAAAPIAAGTATAATTASLAGTATAAAPAPLANTATAATTAPLANAATATTTATVAPTADVAIAHSAMRRTIARRLLESKTTVPHFYLRLDCRADALLSVREQANQAGSCRISVNDLVVKAAAVAFLTVPEMNVSWTEDALIHHSGIDISVAVATDDGLITPVLRDAGHKPMARLSAELSELSRRARAGRLVPHEYQGGHFTVSNLGMFGVPEFSAIINPPQAAILAVGCCERRPVIGSDGTLQAASMMTVTLSVDHRAVDGALAARWLQAFRQAIEAPMSLFV